MRRSVGCNTMNNNFVCSKVILLKLYLILMIRLHYNVENVQRNKSCYIKCGYGVIWIPGVKNTHIILSGWIIHT